MVRPARAASAGQRQRAWRAGGAAVPVKGVPRGGQCGVHSVAQAGRRGAAAARQQGVDRGDPLLRTFSAGVVQGVQRTGPYRPVTIA